MGGMYGRKKASGERSWYLCRTCYGDATCTYGNDQRELGDKIGVTFQQIHKYESGQCRISAALLNELCHIFEISPSEFYTESNADYIHDKPMADLITLIYKLPGNKRDVIAKIAVALNVAD